MKRMLCAVALVIAVTGCQTTGHEITQIDIGASRDQVVATLGRPD
jgi:outer membrane protein assembly factor BamE (lipoprotein component of BamABCDE complex)